MKIVTVKRQCNILVLRENVLDRNNASGRVDEVEPSQKSKHSTQQENTPRTQSRTLNIKCMCKVLNDYIYDFYTYDDFTPWYKQ